jgi:hypothetical protein
MECRNFLKSRYKKSPVVSALVRVRKKMRRPDARIAFAMPPRIGTNIMMVMREDLPTGRQASRRQEKTETSIVLYKFLSSDLLIKSGPYNV